MPAATLRLFHAVQVSQPTAVPLPTPIIARGVQNGYLLDPAIEPTPALLDLIESIVGISGVKSNAAFHKSWRVVRDSSREQLVVQQIVHYLTTYAFEAMGIYRQDTVYIPHEVLELPAVEADVPLVMIKGLTADEIRDSIVALGSGVALASETLTDIMTIVVANAYDVGLLAQIANRELVARLQEHYGIVPTEPTAFLRYLMTRLTAGSLLIKNEYMIDKIKAADGALLDRLLLDAPPDLATIFLRFKPLFLAMKSISKNKHFFNRLRKDAVKLHQPLPEDYLNSVTVQVKQGRLDLNRLEAKLETATIFRKIRLAYALHYRLQTAPSTLYRVRNGRGWATSFAWADELRESTQAALDKVLASIVVAIQPNVMGKRIYIPSYVHYALPATEKQFTGNLPSGTTITVPQDMIVGVHWVNNADRVDLDLSLMDDGLKLGWDGDYRTDDAQILFSGDVVDAPEPLGATELFYLGEVTQPKIVTVNYYNFTPESEVVAKILVASEKPTTFERNYVLDVNSLLTAVPVKITQMQTVLGLIAPVDGQNRFCFAQVAVGNLITAHQREDALHTWRYLMSAFTNPLDFRTILRPAGAIIVDQKPADGDYVDLSPTTLDKATILGLVMGRPWR